jgi:hydroxyethylthiazole kinase-like uncharacterized protein yjeF
MHMPHKRAALLQNGARLHPEVLSTPDCGHCDSYAETRGVAGFDLMRAAGAAIADSIQANWSVRPVLVLCGPGNNGGDGYVCASVLLEAGWPVRVISVVDPQRLRGDAKTAAQQWLGRTDRVDSGDFSDAGIVVDALFGAGLSRAITEPAAGLIARTNQSAAVVVAVDLPSGVGGDAGPVGGAVIDADMTVTFHRPKPAHLLEPAASLCGAVQVADIGIPAGWDEGISSAALINHPDVWMEALPLGRPDTHKHRRGRLVVFSGPMSSTGAARLAAQSGLAIGAGLVTLASPPAALNVNATASTSVMVARLEEQGAATEFLTKHRATASVLGPAAGVGAKTRELVKSATAHEAAVVLDADGLTSFQGQTDELGNLLRPHDVITPHLGEFERLFPGLIATSTNKVTAVQQAAERIGCVVVLKGADTVIAKPDTIPVINRHASPSLATAGSGDVLAGCIGGLITQGMPTYEACCAAVWIHGDVGLSHGPGLIADTVIEGIPESLGRLERLCKRLCAFAKLVSSEL